MKYLSEYFSDNECFAVLDRFCDMAMLTCIGRIIVPAQYEIGKQMSDKTFHHTSGHKFTGNEALITFRFTSSLNDWTSWVRFLQKDHEFIQEEFKNMLKKINMDEYKDDISNMNQLLGTNNY